MRPIQNFCVRARRFLAATGGNLTVILALSAIPLTLALGAGVDYARALVAHSNMADALDAAGLAVGAQTSKPASCSSDGSSSATTGNGPAGSPTSCAALQLVAQQYFKANFVADSLNTVVPTVAISVANQQVVLTTNYNVPTTFLSAADRLMNSSALEGIAVTANSTVVWGQTKLWVSLVLDNTGSMCQPDSNPCPGDTHANIKINALKSASHSLLTTLQNASANPGDVMAGIVPFAKDVNVGTANVGASWIDWTDWDAASTNFPGSTPSSSVGPGSSCPWSSSSYGCLNQPCPWVLDSNSHCTVNPAATTTTSTVPSSGTYAGYICPGSVGSSSAGQTGHYFPFCWDSTANTTTSSRTVSSCSGRSNCTCTTGQNAVCTLTTTTTTYIHTVKPDPHSFWDGCVMDRNQSDDVNDTTPGTLFPAENDDSCAVATVLPMPTTVPASTTAMNTMFTNLNSQIDTMVANGGTNQTIGLAHGMQLQTSGVPYSPPTLGSDTTRYIILLSDGLNTMDRWYGDGSSQSSSVDTRMTAACNEAKTEGFVIYTIFVDLNGTQGSSTILQNCASSSSKYFDLTTSGAIISTFNNIAQQITSLRVSR